VLLQYNFFVKQVDSTTAKSKQKSFLFNRLLYRNNSNENKLQISNSFAHGWIHPGR